MSEAGEEKRIIIRPSWKAYFAWYVLSFLMIPALGVGLILLYFVRKKHTSHSYIITDTQISSVTSKFRRNIDLINIDHIDLKQSWFWKKLDIGTLVLHTNSVNLEIIGVTEPHPFKEILEQAVEAEKERLHQKKEERPREPDFNPGTIDKMDYLTGLWQQGLISDDDFEKERKHFE